MRKLQAVEQEKNIICLCMCCQDYRNDAGQWGKLPQELYGADHRVSHGICPDCLKRVYGRESVIDANKSTQM
ncbi:MAG: hypothetical protein OEX03_05300 [Gammaproteobacteria bacterium]|nr:hypothetical protein [Gammaproteobacteria bacterium]